MSTKMLMAMALACACALPVFANTGVVDLSGVPGANSGTTIPDGTGGMASATATGFFTTSFKNSGAGDAGVYDADATGYGISGAGLSTVYGSGTPTAVKMTLHAGKHTQVTVTGFDVVGYGVNVSGTTWRVNSGVEPDGSWRDTSGTASDGDDSESIVPVGMSSDANGGGFVNIVVDDATTGGNIGIQNVSYTTQIIPEPSSLLLALAGLLGMTLFRGRRQR